MFTGIIEEIGKISNVANIGNGKRIRISVKNLAEGLKEGDSVSVNGACLTVVKSGKDFFEVDVVEETLRRTNLGNLTYGSHVNLEKARKFVDRLDGHIVQGHIDTTGKIEKIQPVQLSKLFYISFPSNYNVYIVPKGSISVDGISLTVVDIENNLFSVSIIPFTIENTILKYRKVGDTVNLEFDIIGKYVVNYIKNIKNENPSSVLQQFYQQPY